MNKSNSHGLADFSSAIRESTIKRLQEVPEGFMNWRLNNTAMSFADIVQHLINVDELFFSITTSKNKTFKWTLGTEEPHLNVDNLTYTSMLKQLEVYEQKRHSIIDKLDDSKLDEHVSDENKHTMTLWWFIMRKLIEHEVYHRGQIAAYLKVLKGEAP